MRRSLLATASLLLASCSDPTSPADDLLVTASVAPSVVRAGDIATVAVTVRNRGSRTHSLPNHCVSRFTVAREDGSVVGPAPIACIAIPFPPTKLPPGDELTIISQWHGDGFTDIADESDGLLPPGTYLLRGRVYAEGEDDPVTSPPVAIMIEE